MQPLERKHLRALKAARKGLRFAVGQAGSESLAPVWLQKVEQQGAFFKRFMTKQQFEELSYKLDVTLGFVSDTPW